MVGYCLTNHVIHKSHAVVFNLRPGIRTDGILQCGALHGGPHFEQDSVVCFQANQRAVLWRDCPVVLLLAIFDLRVSYCVKTGCPIVASITVSIVPLPLRASRASICFSQLSHILPRVCLNDYSAACLPTGADQHPSHSPAPLWHG